LDKIGVVVDALGGFVQFILFYSFFFGFECIDVGIGIDGQFASIGAE
jgi:hypothetical protein